MTDKGLPYAKSILSELGDPGIRLYRQELAYLQLVWMTAVDFRCLPRHNFRVADDTTNNTESGTMSGVKASNLNRLREGGHLRKRT